MESKEKSIQRARESPLAHLLQGVGRGLLHFLRRRSKERQQLGRRVELVQSAARRGHLRDKGMGGGGRVGRGTARRSCGDEARAQVVGRLVAHTCFSQWLWLRAEETERVGGLQESLSEVSRAGGWCWSRLSILEDVRVRSYPCVCAWVRACVPATGLGVERREGQERRAFKKQACSAHAGDTCAQVLVTMPHVRIWISSLPAQQSTENERASSKKECCS
eukprot:817596-Pleurochrysis_carterae.AAC.1